MRSLLLIFLLSIYNYEAQADDVGIPCDPDASRTTISVGDNYQCSIESVGESDIYEFSGEAGNIFQITLTDIGNLGASMVCEVYNGGNLITTLSTVNTGVREEFVLFDNSEYTLLCFESGNNSTDTYNLSLQSRFPLPEENQVISNDVVIEGQVISPVSDSDVFSFEANEGDMQMFTLSDIGNLSASLTAEVYDPSTQLIASINTTNTGIDEVITITDSGSYTVVVHEVGSNNTDTYNIGLQQLFPISSEALSLLYGVSTGNLDIAPVADSDVFTFSGVSGDTIILTLSDIGNLSASVVANLYGPDDQLITQLTATNTGVDTGLLDLTDSGEYSILVREVGSNNIDTYILNLQCFSGSCVDNPDISATPLSANFGEVPVGSSSPARVFTVNNEGEGELNDLAVTSLNAAYSVINDACTGEVLAANESCTFEAVFSPLIDGRIISRLSITSNDMDESDLRLTLVGTGVGGAMPALDGSLSGADVSLITCTNRTTGQAVRILDGLADWDCGLSGLLVNPGDRIQINISGNAQ